MHTTPNFARCCAYPAKFAPISAEFGPSECGQTLAEIGQVCADLNQRRESRQNWASVRAESARSGAGFGRTLPDFAHMWSNFDRTRGQDLPCIGSIRSNSPMFDTIVGQAQRLALRRRARFRRAARRERRERRAPVPPGPGQDPSPRIQKPGRSLARLDSPTRTADPTPAGHLRRRPRMGSASVAATQLLRRNARRWRGRGLEAAALSAPATPGAPAGGRPAHRQYAAKCRSTGWASAGGEFSPQSGEPGA